VTCIHQASAVFYLKSIRHKDKHAKRTDQP
jgi:hypothetical protein